MVLNDFLAILDKVKKRGKAYEAMCPAHDDKKPSLSISEGEDGRILVHCHAGCSLEDILAALSLDARDLFSDNGPRPNNEPFNTYNYVNADNKLLYQVCRFPNKKFVQRRPDGYGGWEWNLKGLERVPYNLPVIRQAINASETIYICEGEKDCNRLSAIGLAATTNSGGAGKWTDKLSAYFKGANVLIIPDNDQTGKDHAMEVAKSLDGVAASIKILELPNLPEKGDISDWLKAGHGKEDLKNLAEGKGVLCTTPINTPCTQTTETSPLVLRPWSEVLSESVEDREWSVHGMLPKTGLAILGGWAKEGKSTLAIHLCRSIAQGKPFLSRETEKTPAIYVNYEMPEDYRAELMAASDVPDGAYWLDRPRHVLSIETVRRIIKQADSDHGLLVIDTFRGAFRLVGDSENQVGGSGVIVRDLQKVAIETGWLILLLHHKNKSGRLSGTGDFQAAADVIMLWKRPNPAEPGALEVEGRMAPIEPLAVKLTLGGAEYLGDAKDTILAEDMKQVLEGLTDDPAPAAEVAEALQMPAGSVRVYLGRLYRDGKIERSGSGKRGNPYLYFKTNDVESVQSVKDRVVQNTENKTPGEAQEERMSLDEFKQACISEFDAEEIPKEAPF